MSVCLRECCVCVSVCVCIQPPFAADPPVIKEDTLGKRMSTIVLNVPNNNCAVNRQHVAVSWARGQCQRNARPGGFVRRFLLLIDLLSCASSACSSELRTRA